MSEQHSMQSLKELWTGYVTEHGHLPAILEAAAQYPEVESWSFDIEDLSKFNVAMAEHLLEMPKASLMAGEIAVQQLIPPANRVSLWLRPRGISEEKRPLDLRARDAGALIAVRALVTENGKPTAHYKVAVFQCMRCGAMHRVEQDAPGKLKEPIECYQDNGGCKRASTSTRFRCMTNFSDLPDPFASSFEDRDLEFSETVDEQWLKVQDLPDELRDREVPTTYKVRLEGSDVVGKALPGERVLLHCILRADNGKRVVSPEMYLDALNLENLSRTSIEVTEEDEVRLRALADSVDSPMDELLVPSLAPHVVGLDDPKHGIVCQLLGGLSGDTGDKILRSELHIMMIGPPATGKSQLLKHVARLVERATYVNADMATRAGLVAKAEREGDGWKAVPGKVVLSDGSVCCVDELNRMPDEDKGMLLEMMEHGEVTVAKAGSATFKARTAILAAANPEPGYYSDYRDSVKMSEALASRFALVYIVKDTKEKRKALQKAMRPYYGLGEKSETAQLDTGDLARYLVMAKRITPRVTEPAALMIEMHHDSLREGETTWTDRVLEDLYRLSVALARSRLSETVDEQDAIAAIGVHSGGAWGEKDTLFDIDMIATGQPQSQQERIKVVLGLVQKFEGSDGVPYSKLKGEATKRKVSDLELTQALKRLHDDGKVIE